MSRDRLEVSVGVQFWADEDGWLWVETTVCQPLVKLQDIQPQVQPDVAELERWYKLRDRRRKPRA